MKTTPDTYEFVARKSDIDLQRIVTEAPEDTNIILVEEKTREGQPAGVVVLVSTELSRNPKVLNKRLYDTPLKELFELSREHNDTNSFVSFRFRERKLPGFVKQQIAGIQRALNPTPKNRKVKVSLY